MYTISQGTWYRERRSRVNAPLDWPYCEHDLEQVYEYCTEVERQTAVCDPQKARNRMYLQQERDTAPVDPGRSAWDERGGSGIESYVVGAAGATVAGAAVSDTVGLYS